MYELQKKINELPDELKKEVYDFIDFLISKRKKRKAKAGLDWIGGLKEYRNNYTSVELQHKVSEWRKDYVPPGH